MAVCSICGYSVTAQQATLCEVRFIVYGRDGDAFDYGPSDRHEAHQAYMDAWLSHLIARGPTLSPDGEDHTGSVHVIEVDNADIARGFAVRTVRAGWLVRGRFGDPDGPGRRRNHVGPSTSSC